MLLLLVIIGLVVLAFFVLGFVISGCSSSPSSRRWCA